MSPYVTIPDGTSVIAHGILTSARRIEAAVTNTFTTQAGIDLAKGEIAKIKESLTELEKRL